MKNKNLFFDFRLFAFVFILILIGCTSNTSENKGNKDSLTLNATAESDVKDMIFSVPNPIETAFFVQSSGVVFDKKLLNPYEKASNYISSKDKAVNLGIYSVDLCLASLNNQSQLLINYMAAIKTLSNDLGFLDAIGKSVLDDMGKHLSDRDYILNLISEKIIKNTSALTEERKQMGAFIVYGVYLEGLYIVSEYASKTKKPDLNLVSGIIEQKNTLINIQNLIKQFNSSDLNVILEDLNKISTKFAAIPASYTETVPVYDSIKKETVIKSKLKSNVPVETLKDVFSTNISIRNSYTK